MFHPIRNLVRAAVEPHVLAAGYTPEQFDRLYGQIGDGTILRLLTQIGQWVLRNGPELIQLVAAVLALFAAKEPPANPPADPAG